MDYYANYRFFVLGGCSYITHLLFRGDIVALCNSSGQSIKTVFQVIAGYDRCSGQCVHKTKSVRLCQSNDPISRISIMEAASGICNCSLPFIYLGIPIVNGKYKTSYFNGLIEEVQKNCLTASCFLSDGDRLLSMFTMWSY